MYTGRATTWSWLGSFKQLSNTAVAIFTPEHDNTGGVSTHEHSYTVGAVSTLEHSNTLGTGRQQYCRGHIHTRTWQHWGLYPHMNTATLWGPYPHYNTAILCRLEDSHTVEAIST